MRGSLATLRRLYERVPPDVRAGLPYAVVLALSLGFAVVLGAHQSNAQPSPDRPFGWAGPSAFGNAVAMVRKDLVLAATLPALLMGANALRRRDPARDGALPLIGIFAAHALMLGVAALAAAQIGAWGSFYAPEGAFWAFTVAHGLLAIAFYAIGFLAATIAPRFALPAALAAWAAFVLYYDDLVETLVLREIGLPGVQEGAFPSWFFVAQALSPLAAYRGILILWREEFRDYVEKIILGEAQLPAWMNPGVFSAALFLLWIALPLALALGIWRLRAWRATRRTPSAVAQETFAVQ